MIQIKDKQNYTKGNIPINNKLLNKYSNVEEIFNITQKNNYIKLINYTYFNLKDITSSELYKLVNKIFKSTHTTNRFKNFNNIIYISNKDIKESVNKIFYNPNQKKLLREHLIVFMNIGKIIETATLISQSLENKNRENNNLWNYYINWIKINNEDYLLEFDVVSRNNGENHYRLQRLIKKQAFQLETQ